MAKADRILGLLPSFFRAADPNTLFREVVTALSAPIEEADTLLFRIQRAHRVNVAEDAGDVARLAGLLDLDAQHFEDIHDDPALAYSERLDLMRARIRRIARLHLVGLGTPWAVLEAAAIFLNAEIVPERPGEPLVKHVDPHGYSHKAMLAFPRVPEAPREPLYLHESPLRRQKVDVAERWPLDAWEITNQTPELSPVRIVIRGIGDRTVRPSVFCPATQAGVVFNGVVPDGQTLVIDTYDGATLDKDPVDEWVIGFRGVIADFSREGQPWAVDDRVTTGPYDGRAGRTSDQPGRGGAVPPAPAGHSEWRFKVADGLYDGADFDYCALATPVETIGVWDEDFNFDECVFAYPASGAVGMAWDERVTCSFKLLVPGHVPSPPPAAAPGAAAPPAANPPAPSTNAVARIAGVMPRFKAAGILALVDTSRDAWILGASVIRAGDASDGEGVDFHATRLVNPRTELFVP